MGIFRPKIAIFHQALFQILSNHPSKNCLKFMKMAEFFHERSQVVLSEGETFGSEGKGFVRLNFATSPMILSDILYRMDRAIQDS